MNKYWFQKPTKHILSDYFNIEVDEKTSTSIESWIMGHKDPIDCWYLVYAIVNRLNNPIIGINFIIGPYFKYLKTATNGHLTGRQRYYINELLQFVELGKIDKQFIESVFLEIMEYTNNLDEEKLLEMFNSSQELTDDGYIKNSSDYNILVLIDLTITEYGQIRFGEKFVSNLISEPKYKLTNSSDIDILIAKVITENMDKVSQVKDNPKMISWLTGQVMKTLKGKGNGQDITNKIIIMIENMEIK